MEKTMSYTQGYTGGISGVQQSVNSTYANQLGYGENSSTAPASGLLLLADRVAEATQRVMAVSIMLDQLALGIHGPRPAEVGKDPAPPQSDSLRSRVDALLGQISRLESAAQSVAH